MQLGRLTAIDQAVITKYIKVLKLLKSVTNCLQGYGKASTYSALYKVIPVFKSLTANLNTCLQLYTAVNFQLAKVLEDYIAINVRAARKKATTYLNKLLKVPVYYAATALYLRYKHYFKRLQHNKPKLL